MSVSNISQPAGRVSESADAILLKPRDAAALLAISERKLWGLARTGQVPFVKVGASRRYRRVDLENFVAGQVRIGGDE
jgi:excisionase family DNA binding protein